MLGAFRIGHVVYYGVGSGHLRAFAGGRQVDARLVGLSFDVFVAAQDWAEAHMNLRLYSGCCDW